MHDVKAARAQAEVERLHVDHDLSADLAAAHQAGVGDRLPDRRRLAGELDP